jgi:GT2 family glycosyltransferase
MIDLSIIIISFNTKEFLKQCLESISTNVSDSISFEVIVVDNGSSDGSIQLISNFKFQISNFKWIQNNENLGFARANNIGIKQATGRYILFLNSDTKIIYKYTFEEMVSFMDFHPKAGAASCFVELPDKKLDDASHRGFPTPWRAFCHFSGIGSIFPNSSFFNGYHLGYKSMDNVHEIDAVAGAFMMIRRQAGEEVGWWDEDYFFYGEDLDFCYKLKQKGWKIYFVPTTKILHYKGISSGIKPHSAHLSIADKKTKKMITNARYNAMRIFYRKHYFCLYPRLINKLVLFGVDIKRLMSLQQYK